MIVPPTETPILETPVVVAAPIEPVLVPPAELASSKFAALARGAKANQAAKEALKADRELLGRDRESLAPLQAQIKAFEDAKRDALKDPLAFLKSAGLTIDQLNEFYLNGGDQTEDMKMTEVQREIAAFKKEQEDAKASALELEKTTAEKANQVAIQAWHKGILEELARDTDQYPLVAITGQQAEVAKIIEQHYEKTNEAMTTATAAKLLHEHYESMVEQAILTKSYLAKHPPKVEQQPVKKPLTSERTITSLQTKSSAPITPSPKMTDQQRTALAIETYHALKRSN